MYDIRILFIPKVNLFLFLVHSSNPVVLSGRVQDMEISLQ